MPALREVLSGLENASVRVGVKSLYGNDLVNKDSLNGSTVKVIIETPLSIRWLFFKIWFGLDDRVLFIEIPSDRKDAHDDYYCFFDVN